MNKTLKYLAWACVVAALAAPVALADGDKKVNDDAAVARSLDIFNTLYIQVTSVCGSSKNNRPPKRWLLSTIRRRVAGQTARRWLLLNT